MIKRFIIKSSLAILLLFIIVIGGAFVSSAYVRTKSFDNANTESNLFLLKAETKYDLGILGISHGRNFSRGAHHGILEEKTGKKILNLAQGGGDCGINEQNFYLEYAYDLEVKIDTLVYVLSPPLMYGVLNQVTTTFKNEPLDFRFLKQYAQYPSENKWTRLGTYIIGKWQGKWLSHSPIKKRPEHQDELYEIDSALVENGFGMAYVEGLDDEEFQRNTDRIEKLINLTQTNGTAVVFMIPPAVFGKWPGHENLISFFVEMKKTHNISYYDFSSSMPKPEYYYDHHHLNTKGVKHFVEKHFTPMLKEHE